LRNLGLLRLEKGDQTTAREIFRLALELKPAYPLLQEEYARLKKP
jgi:Tfp pilus assembly protein PilF